MWFNMHLLILEIHQVLTAFKVPLKMILINDFGKYSEKNNRVHLGKMLSMRDLGLID